MSKITIVTGIWDIGRDSLTEGWSRSYQHYLDQFEKLLQIEENLIIFGDEDLEKFVSSKRDPSKTQFIRRDVDWFKNNEFYNNIQTIRNDTKWRNQVGWLSDSTQARLELYNPLVMSKMFLLHDAKIMDKFDSEFLFWLDGGITNTVHPGYFTHDKVFNKLSKYITKFSFVCFPYEAHNEIHGFEYSKLNQLAGDKVMKVARGGFFGGPKESISEINAVYYNLLNTTLRDGYMGTEESIFSIMCYKNADIVNYFEIDGNGLIGKFFENLKNDELVVKTESKTKSGSIKPLDPKSVALYVITFNSPKQFETLIESFKAYDKNFLEKPKKFLLNNSTDNSTFEEYNHLCEIYDFEHIVPEEGNLGICGGRQFIAEHFDKTGLEYMHFFEDDMFFFPNEGICRNGFNRYVEDFYIKTLEIVHKEGFDFLKLNFSEFFGDNGTQWAWYNVPQKVREEFWPNNIRLPELGLDPNAPKTQFESIKSHKSIPYVGGEIYYCNWPQIVSKEGSRKMFLETTWAHPFEQTWMSHIYQETKKGSIHPGLLLMTPTEHNRFDHYERSLRKES
jgi:hypothetical protein